MKVIHKDIGKLFLVKDSVLAKVTVTCQLPNASFSINEWHIFWITVKRSSNDPKFVSIQWSNRTIIDGQRYLKMFDQSICIDLSFHLCSLISLERTLYGDSEYVSFIDRKWGVGSWHVTVILAKTLSLTKNNFPTSLWILFILSNMDTPQWILPIYGNFYFCKPTDSCQ